MLPLGHTGITVAVIRVIESHFQWLTVDYRLLLVASLLPDLIDKPISDLFSSYPTFSSRHYGHSLMFLFILLIAAMVQWCWRNNMTGLIICIGVLSHDVLDFVSHHEDWADRALFNTNILLTFEIFGGCILIYFFIGLVLHNKVAYFIKTGGL